MCVYVYMGYGALYMLSGTVSLKTTMACVHMTICQNELKQNFEYRAHQENIPQKNIVCSCNARSLIPKLLRNSFQTPRGNLILKYAIIYNVLLFATLFFQSNFLGEDWDPQKTLGTPIWSDMWVPRPRMKNPSAIPALSWGNHFQLL